MNGDTENVTVTKPKSLEPISNITKHGRLPVLGSDFNDFFLYCPSTGSDALSPWETIGSKRFRNFMLCKEPTTEKVVDAGGLPAGIARKGSGSWKAWLNKSPNLKISSH
ncbi:hypothetical protein HS088_TW05G00759 [Tripterygium wilfordii]|uniref:DUF7054 domain-containing protein n=1 Tax=Tripterygium wilfordii TaxID=458696 RepID=A0A7J7DNY6_TRIWF|nr:hypothetical protein HS088_TW05G00759 [Tripterygium wilfordii]